jgi:hypothetical protein
MSIRWKLPHSLGDLFDPSHQQAITAPLEELKPSALLRFVMPAQAGIQRTKPTVVESGYRLAPA